ncbi:MAG: Rap1a/Tai family immunity protein [Janthinobacterium lividum]
MLASALLLILAGTPGTADAVAELSRGSALYRVCQAEVRLMDLPNLSHATQSDLLNGAYCVGYLNGFLSNLRPTAAVCTGGANTGTLIRAYVEFMARNPDMLNQDRRIGLARALSDTYRCPLDSSPDPGNSAKRTL